MYFYPKITTSLLLGKACLASLKGNNKFLLFPFLSVVLTGAVIITFILPLIFSGSTAAPIIIPLSFKSYCVLFAYYLLNSAITIFFNTALAAVVYKTSNGKKTGLSEGIKEALMHIRSITVYALLSSFAGIALYKITEKLRIPGSVIPIIAGTSLNITVYLVIPLMIIENKDIFTSIKRSTEIIKKKWGESLTAGLIINTGFIPFYLFFLLISIPWTLLFPSSSVLTLIFIFFLSCIIALYLISSFISAIESIYSVVLFRYASEGIADPNFNEQYLKKAFAPNNTNNWSIK